MMGLLYWGCLSRPGHLELVIGDDVPLTTCKPRMLLLWEAFQLNLPKKKYGPFDVFDLFTSFIIQFAPLKSLFVQCNVLV